MNYQQVFSRGTGVFDLLLNYATINFNTNAVINDNEVDMNSFFKTLLMGLLLCVVFASQAEGVLQDTTGHKTKVSDLKGKWVLVNYWADWCGTCVEEIPQLNVFNKHRHADVAFFAVNYDSPSTERLNHYIKKLRIHYPVLVKNPAKQLKLGRFSVLPVTFIINPDGKVVDKIYSAQTSQSLNQALDKAKAKYEGKKAKKAKRH